MELLKSWAMSVAGIVVFGSVCEMILPGGSFQKYVRLAIGLLLILAMLSPMQRLVKEGMKLEAPKPESRADIKRTEAEERQNADVIRIYRQTLEKKLEAALREQEGSLSYDVQCEVEESDPDTFGSIKRAVVSINAEPDATLAQEVKECLRQNFGITGERVTVRYLKESNE